MSKKLHYEDYFPHSANASNDPKLMALIDQGGMRAYGLYWCIIELLRGQDNYQLPYTPTTIKRLARTCRVHKKTIYQVLEDFDLFVLEDGMIRSRGLSTRMQHLDDKREKISENARRAATAKWQKIKGHESADAVQDKSSQEKPSQGKASDTPPFIPPKGDKLNFWDVFQPPVYALNPKTHNYEGFCRKLQEIGLQESAPLQELMVLAEYGRIGNPCWKIFAKQPLSYFKGLQNPAQSLIRSIKRRIESGPNNF